MQAKDRFSTQASAYARYRPTYPPELYDFIRQHVPAKGTAWDCATGNGQAARALAAFMQKVEATDISQPQLAQAPAHPAIQYHQMPAEQTTFTPDTFDLVTVATALHWFKHQAFFKEVQRVAKPGALFVAWTYGLVSLRPPMNPVVLAFHEQTMAPYWDPERKHVDQGYRSILFPLAPLPVPTLGIEVQWQPEDIKGYFSTWSSVQNCIKATGQDPVPALYKKLMALWPAHQSTITARWQLHVLAGFVQ